MVLVALLFLPCMVIVTTVALPLLLFVIAVIAIPILLYYDRSNIMQKFIIENICTYTSGGGAEFSSTTVDVVGDVTTTTPTAIGVSTRSDRFELETQTDRASISASSFKKKKVTFQVCSEYSQSGAFARQQQEPATLRSQSLSVCPNESFLRNGRRHSPYHFGSRGAAPVMDIRYQNALKQHGLDHMYHHQICAG
jgi:hypothetical protein